MGESRRMRPIPRWNWRISSHLFGRQDVDEEKSLSNFLKLAFRLILDQRFDTKERQKGLKTEERAGMVYGF